jgi:RNA polymerase sigma-70 factor (ECF subfamily)
MKIVRCKEDAEDIVQETFLKWLSIDQKSIQNTKAYLVRAVTNNCINHLNSLKHKKEQCVESITEAFHHFKETNLAHLDLEINLSAAFSALQSKLEPLERAVYILKEAFDFDYDSLQLALDKKKDHCRQLFCRAKKKLQEETSKISISEKTKLFETFKNACHRGNAVELVSEFKKDISITVAKKAKN